MFNNLIESKRKREANAGGTVTSVIAHIALIALAVWITAQAGVAAAKEKVQEDVKFVEVKKPPPPEPEKPPPPPPDVVVKPPPPKGFQTLQAPINIPDKIPEVDLSKAVTNEADFSGKGVEGGVAKGVAGGKGPVSDQPYFEFQVEKPVLAKESNPRPSYPSMLESAHVEGQVLVQFVVDTSGHAEMNTFKVLKSSNDLFTSSVKKVLPKMQFYPAEVGGHKVRQLVQMPFGFTVPK